MWELLPENPAGCASLRHLYHDEALPMTELQAKFNRTAIEGMPLLFVSTTPTTAIATPTTATCLQSHYNQNLFIYFCFALILM
jgi:hypothetical protein